MIRKLLFLGFLFIGVLPPPEAAGSTPADSSGIVGASAGKEKYTRYFNISYVSQRFSFADEDNNARSDYGVALTRGRTYYLHRTPIAKMLRFGIDWTTFDLNFAGYSSKEYYDVDEREMVTDKMYQLELGMQVGPSLTVNPVSNLRINGYFRYAPSATGYYDSEEFYYNYGSFFVAGAAVSYKVISLGLESRWGRSKFKVEGEDSRGNTLSEKVRVNTAGTRFYVSFRF